jgi:hypothetical protein
VLGYAGEPYLRFLRAGVFENVRSPNAYLDRFRFPPSRAPARFDPKAPPNWVRVADGVTYQWHDHRIHWKSTTPPPAVRRQPNRVHLIFNWRIPARTASKPFLIKGFLGYSPPPKTVGDDGRDWLLPVLLGGLAAVALAVGMGARRLKRRAP